MQKVGSGGKILEVCFDFNKKYLISHQRQVAVFVS